MPPLQLRPRPASCPCLCPAVAEEGELSQLWAAQRQRLQVRASRLRLLDLRVARLCLAALKQALARCSFPYWFPNLNLNSRFVLQAVVETFQLQYLLVGMTPLAGPW